MSDNETQPSREQLLDELRRVAGIVDSAPTTADINEHGQYSHGPYYRVFGDWASALEQADFSPSDKQSSPNQRHSKQELLSEIQQLTEMLGRPPSSREMDKLGEYSSESCQYRFGSWNQAVSMAGFDPNPAREDREATSTEALHQKESWKDLREKVIDEAGNECERCGISKSSHREKYCTGLNVHHITPVSEFDDARDANEQENLRVLCSRCHGIVEQGDR